MMNDDATIEEIAEWISRMGDGVLNKAGTVVADCACLACLTTITACSVLARAIRDGSWRGAPAPAISLAERKSRSKRDTEPEPGETP